VILEALAEFDVDVVATVGGKLDPASFGQIAPNIRVERYVPQSFLLDQASVVVSHAGAGTLIAAASAGKVQLCMPISADQWENADRLSAVEAGITLEPDDRDVDAIGRSIDQLLADTSMHANAAVLADSFAAMPQPGELVPDLEQLL
jgi:UDP:flavonoid glycosyltransferase YjiC (YdhE family)